MFRPAIFNRRFLRRRRSWVPSRLSSLILWYNADDLADGAIASWAPRVGIGTLVGTATKSATALYERPAVTLDGVADVLELNSTVGSSWPSGARNLTIAILGEIATASGSQTNIIGFGGTASGTNCQIRKDTSNRVNLSDGTTTTGYTAGGINSALSPAIIFGEWANGNQSGRQNTVLFGPNASTGLIGTTRVRVGANLATTPAAFCGVKIRHILVLNGSLSDADRQRLEGWLARDIENPALLPADHPYQWEEALFAEEAGPAFVLPAYFDVADAETAAANGWRVTMSWGGSLTSASDKTTVPVFPLTDWSAQALDKVIASNWTGRRWGFLWANRCTTNYSYIYKPNPIFPTITLSGKQCRIEYSTVDKANAATIVRAMHWLGFTQAEYEAVAVAAGIPTSSIYTRAALAASPATVFVADSRYQSGLYKVALDIIYLSDQRLSDASDYEGIELDYEVQDGRSEAETTAFLSALAGYAHTAGKKLILYTNRLDGFGTPKSGLGSNLPSVYAAVDQVGLLLTYGVPPASSLAAQLALIGAYSPSKIMIIVDMRMDPATDGVSIRAEMVSRSLNQVKFWAAGVTLGGAVATSQGNAIINRVVFDA